VDFVVGGIWLGALAVLLGLALRDGGARWTRLRRSPRPASREYAVALDAVCRAGGRLLLVGGEVLLLVTVLALVAGVGDALGAVVVAAAAAVVAAGIVAWTLRSHRAHLRPLAAWPAHPGAALGEDGPPPLAVAIDRGLAATGSVPNAGPNPVEAEDDADLAEDGDDPGLGPREVVPIPAEAEPGETGPEPAIPEATPDGDDDRVAASRPVEAPSSPDRAEAATIHGGASSDLVPLLPAAIDVADPVGGEPLGPIIEPDGEPDADEIERLEFAGREVGQRRSG